jgi:hypothetical protein
MLELNIQLFGGRGANFSIKRNVSAQFGRSSNLIIPKGTQMRNVIVIAGAGSKRKIDVINTLTKKYNGSSKNWSKRVAIAKINGKKAEVHYYQNKKDNIGRVEYKIKRWLE